MVLEEANLSSDFLFFVFVCVCVFLIGIDRANRLTNEETPLWGDNWVSPCVLFYSG